VATIQENSGILKRFATGYESDPTDHYSRSKVSAAFWNNTLWMFYGDSVDHDSQINELADGRGPLKICGFYFSRDGLSNGPFVRDFTNISTKYEPQVLIPVDSNRAYTLSHKSEFRLTRWNDPTQFIDTLIESGTPTNYNNSIKIITRAFRMVEMLLKKVYIYIEYNDTDSFVVKVYSDVTKQVATCTYTQNRVEGMTSYADFQHRDFVVIKTGLDMRHAFYHHVEITKQIPSTGDVEIHDVKLLVDGEITRRSDIHSDQMGAATNTTFVVEADTDPEVNPHA